MGNSVSSLNRDSGVDEAGASPTIPEAGGSGASAVGSVTGGPRKTDEIRGGFVLRAKSDEQPSRRRSLVERTGMKTFVQVSLFKIFKCCNNEENDCQLVWRIIMYNSMIQYSVKLEHYWSLT